MYGGREKSLREELRNVEFRGVTLKLPGIHSVRRGILCMVLHFLPDQKLAMAEPLAGSRAAAAPSSRRPGGHNQDWMRDQMRTCLVNELMMNRVGDRSFEVHYDTPGAYAGEKMVRTEIAR